MRSSHFCWSAVNVWPGGDLREGPLDPLAAVSSGASSFAACFTIEMMSTSGFLVRDRVRLLEVLLGEPERVRPELVPQLPQRRGAPVARAVEQDADGLDVLGVLPDEPREGDEVVLRLVLLPPTSRSTIVERHRRRDCSYATMKVRSGRL